MEPNLPRHIAIIMDGNGRWAQDRGLARVDGHRAGAKSVRRVVEECRKLGVRYLTLFSFSTENWNRERSEVTGLMQLFRDYLDSELPTLLENDIRLRAIGDLERLPFGVRSALKRNIDKTRENKSMDLILAVSYGSREEIVAAAKNIASMVKSGALELSQIDAKAFSDALWTADVPDPDLLIRTSGEMRISNFLLWQLAYAEIVVTPEFWPEFNESSLNRCIDEYRLRERRFGLSGEQVKSKQVHTQ